MDGRQMLANNNKPPTINNGLSSKGYHYNMNGTLNENAVESIFQSNKANSVMLIDADGCPTDANIMGPLVKMDLSGQRVLAPFDAFKFPTSEMVFFRAVVTSCISECKPVVCSANSPSSNHFAVEPSSYSTPTLDEQSVTLMASTSRNMPTRVSPSASALSADNSERQTTYLPTTTTTCAPKATTSSESQQNRSASTVAVMARTSPADFESTKPELLEQPFKAPNRSEPIAPNGDSLTTVAGFGVQDSGWPSNGIDQLVDQFAAEQLKGQQQVNITNNHHGKTPPRPTNWSAPNDKTSSINLDSLSLEEKQKLVKLFETKLRQQLQNSASKPNESIADVADLYTGFLTSIMLNGHSTKEAGDALDFKRQEGERSVSSLARLRSYLSYLLDANRLDTGERRTAAEIMRVLDQQQKVQNLGHPNQADLKADQLSGNYLDNYDDLSSASTSGSTSASSPSIQSPVSTATIRSQQLVAATSSNPSQSRSRLANSASATNANKSQQAPAEQKQRKRDKANLQALADSYLGAFQSFGRKRRRRQTSDEDEQLISSGFVRSEQPQWAQLAPSEKFPSNSARFTRSLVEMYHTAANSEQQSRAKRAAEPSYDMDELVVQSIKIFDRLHFHEGAQNPSKKPTRHSRGSLITHGSHSSARHAFHNKSESQDEAESLEPDRSWSLSSVLSLLLIAMSFIFFQLLLVLVCFSNWARRRKSRSSKQQIPTPQLDFSSKSSSLLSIVDCYSRLGSSTASHVSSNSPIVTGRSRMMDERSSQQVAGRKGHRFLPAESSRFIKSDKVSHVGPHKSLACIQHTGMICIVCLAANDKQHL